MDETGERIRPNTGYPHSDPCILHWNPVLDALHFDDRQQNAHMVPSCVCCQLGCPSLVSNATRNIFSGTVHPMDRQIRALSWKLAVALARCTGRGPGSGTLDDLAVDRISAARVQLWHSHNFPVAFARWWRERRRQTGSEPAPYS
jgi:hypothetical protein